MMIYIKVNVCEIYKFDISKLGKNNINKTIAEIVFSSLDFTKFFDFMYKKIS